MASEKDYGGQEGLQLVQAVWQLADQIRGKAWHMEHHEFGKSGANYLDGYWKNADDIFNPTTEYGLVSQLIDLNKKLIDLKSSNNG